MTSGVSHTNSSCCWMMSEAFDFFPPLRPQDRDLRPLMLFVRCRSDQRTTSASSSRYGKVDCSRADENFYWDSTASKADEAGRHPRKLNRLDSLALKLHCSVYPESAKHLSATLRAVAAIPAVRQAELPMLESMLVVTPSLRLRIFGHCPVALQQSPIHAQTWRF